jgi:hypothetical protein
MAVFRRDSRGGLYVTHWDDAETGPNWRTKFIEASPGAGDFANTRLAALSRQKDHLEVFYPTPQGTLKNAWNYHGPDSPWSSDTLVRDRLVSLQGGIAALSRFDKHMEVFWIDRYGAVKNAWFYDDNTGPPWEIGEIAPNGSAVIPTPD